MQCPQCRHENAAGQKFCGECGARGQREDAHRALADVYGWFTEGFDTQDLRAAKVLLDELAPG